MKFEKQKKIETKTGKVRKTGPEKKPVRNRTGIF
jgi:hypothetical protein